MKNHTSSMLRPMLVLLACAMVAPAIVYPIFLMKVMCFAIFACAVNLLVGYAGLLSLGHSMFFGMSACHHGPYAQGVGWLFEAALPAAVLPARRWA